ncbi:MAG: hypothetical protein IT241_06215 [Bacteroidia bacterium]|nr:hypothetical protein [Bacteroidia bacterium]
MMNSAKTLLDTLFILAPAVLVLITSFFLIKKFLDNQHRLKVIELKMQFQKDIMPLRFQAYERLVLFLERITPNNLLHRIYLPDYSVKEFHLELLSAIRQEFEHNITQQIYVTSDAWSSVKTARDEVIKLLNKAASQVISQDKASALNKAVFDLIMNENWNKVEESIEEIKSEMNRNQ